MCGKSFPWLDGLAEGERFTRLLITSGAGFIGSTLVRHLIRETDHEVVNLDKLTYAANPDSLATVSDSPRYSFEKADVCDAGAVREILARHLPDAIVHLAAESHVDRSIDGPAAFILTNVVGTGVLLEAARDYWWDLPGDRRDAFRFHHVSTDEVFGSLGAEGMFTETTAYDPSSPYAASKAAADHLARAWHRTYGLPVVLSNCSNNYGPYQFPEKLVPLMIVKALAGEALPVYGDGGQRRDWLHVEDHVLGLLEVLFRGTPGECYNIGGGSERSNLEVVETLCDIVDQLAPDAGPGPRRRLIAFVEDRPGHDRRYAMDTTKIERQLGWRPRHDFASGLGETVRWYLDHREWWRPLLDARYSGERLGAPRPAAGSGK